MWGHRAGDTTLPLNGDDGAPAPAWYDTMNAAVRGGEEAAQAPRSEARQGGRA
jgi:hypothetical protein